MAHGYLCMDRFSPAIRFVSGLVEGIHFRAFRESGLDFYDHRLYAALSMAHSVCIMRYQTQAVMSIDKYDSGNGYMGNIPISN